MTRRTSGETIETARPLWRHRRATRLFVPAALNAIGLHERLGYRRLERRVVAVGGVDLP
ncbi:hypothetical protein [Elioraea sp.]|uniref:hypothetical protein n=1 Tax=Elioraea sp. TaxID=2185103 RepID=UPI0025B7ACA2|nr:hypothetical protein [Elioraea sp.]